MKMRPRLTALAATFSLLTSCSEPDTDETDEDLAAARGNVILVLADDLSWNLVEHMDNVKQMQRDGATFTSYFVTDSLCCPSRSTIFTGDFPHNTGVFSNKGDDGGYDTYLRNDNDKHTFQLALSRAGYRTAFGGKLLNGYSVAPRTPQPRGWTRSFLADNGYRNYDYDLNIDGDVRHFGSAPADYLTDVIGDLGVRFVEHSAGKPFLLELSTFAPHAPFTPAPRHEHMFPDLEAPRGPAFDQKPRNAPPWLASLPPLDRDDFQRFDRSFRDRARSVQAIDELIGKLRRAVARLPAAQRDRTYIVFTSDNGYHFGQHGLRGGKQTAFTHDIRVPLIVVGPGIAPGTTIDEIAQNTDLAPTFAAIGKVPALGDPDGRSLLPLLHGQAVPGWRDVALIEHRREQPQAADDPDLAELNGGDPPTYSALRSHRFLYVQYRGGEREYYDLDTDPHELDNIYGSLPAARKEALEERTRALVQCAGDDCQAAGRMP